MESPTAGRSGTVQLNSISLFFLEMTSGPEHGQQLSYQLVEEHDNRIASLGAEYLQLKNINTIQCLEPE